MLDSRYKKTLVEEHGLTLGQVMGMPQEQLVKQFEVTESAASTIGQRAASAVRQKQLKSWAVQGQIAKQVAEDKCKSAIKRARAQSARARDTSTDTFLSRTKAHCTSPPVWVKRPESE